MPGQYRDNPVSVAELVFVNRSQERIADGRQKAVAKGLCADILTPRA
ncbi:hypothetical protein [Akkermansia muciniphila]|nr:hypothetical protein [Akkermansia muciniphila]